MRFSHSSAAVLILMLHLIVPHALIIRTWARYYSSITTWRVQALLLASYIGFIFPSDRGCAPAPIFAMRFVSSQSFPPSDPSCG